MTIASISEWFDELLEELEEGGTWSSDMSAIFDEVANGGFDGL